MSEDETIPPIEQRSFVGKADVKATESLEKIPAPEVSLLLIAGYMKEIRDALKSLVEIFKNASKSTPTPTVQSAPSPLPQPKPVEMQPNIQAIKSAFDEALQNLLSFDAETSAQYVIIKPRQFLGHDNFAKIAAIVRQLNGQYISKGRDSHFIVPKIKGK